MIAATEAEQAMLFLSWHRVAANHHELRDADGTVWADVLPYTVEHARKGQMIATARHADLPRTTRGPWWTTGYNVAGARTGIVAWIRDHAWDRFEVVPADEQQSRQQEEDDAVAAAADAVNAAIAAAEREGVRARRAALAAAQIALPFAGLAL